MHNHMENRHIHHQRHTRAQGMLEEVLRAEMLYHCRAIEILEPLCVSMRRLDPDRAMEVGGWVGW